MACRRRGQLGDIVDVVDAANGARAERGQAREAIDLGRVAHLVGEQQVLDAAAHEGLGLGDFLAADAAGVAEPLLQQRDVDGFVHFAVHAMTQAHVGGEPAHLANVAFERVEVEHQARRLNIFLVRADLGGHAVAWLEQGAGHGLGHGWWMHACSR